MGRKPRVTVKAVVPGVGTPHGVAPGRVHVQSVSEADAQVLLAKPGSIKLCHLFTIRTSNPNLAAFWTAIGFNVKLKTRKASKS